MSKVTAVEIPFININDENVKLIAWVVGEGDVVHEGQNIAEIETSKAMVELLSPATGTIHLKVQAGEEIRVSSVVAYIGDQNSPDLDTSSREFLLVSRSVVTVPEAIGPSGTRFSNKALELIQSRQIPLSAFAGTSMIREQDVLDYIKSPSGDFNAQNLLHSALNGISTSGVTFPANFSNFLNKDSGCMEQAFLDRLRNDAERIGNMESVDKCNLYRAHGADIGEGTFIGKGTVIVAPRIQIGDHVQIGQNGSIILRERFAAGALSSFREGLNVRGATAIFGQNIFAGSRIQIGGGGHADPWALLVVGDNVYLGNDLFINICRPVLIGKEVFLTQRAILVTHNIGHSVLEGNENTFAPIVLEDFSQVGMNSTIYAGARIGQSSILGSNSYLISAIPNGKLAMGVPAQVIRDAARSIDRPKQLQIAETMIRQFHELLSLKGTAVSPIQSFPFMNFDVFHGKKKYQIGFAESASPAGPDFWAGDENVLWTFESSGAANPSHVTEMNLLAKKLNGSSGVFVDSSREFLRKRGIRLEPGPWRYQMGLI
jgi:acetyltransferase-like isoleucine patch superfamily enzyme